MPVGFLPIVLGIFFIVFPEPATTAIGVGMVAFGCYQIKRNEGRKQERREMEEDRLQVSGKSNSKKESLGFFNKKEVTEEEV